MIFEVLDLLKMIEHMLKNKQKCSTKRWWKHGLNAHEPSLQGSAQIELSLEKMFVRVLDLLKTIEHMLPPKNVLVVRLSYTSNWDFYYTTKQFLHQNLSQ